MAQNLIHLPSPNHTTVLQKSQNPFELCVLQAYFQGGKLQDLTVCVFLISAATVRLLAPKLKQFTPTNSPQETAFPLQSRQQ